MLAQHYNMIIDDYSSLVISEINWAPFLRYSTHSPKPENSPKAQNSKKNQQTAKAPAAVTQYFHLLQANIIFNISLALAYAMHLLRTAAPTNCTTQNTYYNLSLSAVTYLNQKPVISTTRELHEISEMALH